MLPPLSQLCRPLQHGSTTPPASSHLHASPRRLPAARHPSICRPCACHDRHGHCPADSSPPPWHKLSTSSKFPSSHPRACPTRAVPFPFFSLLPNAPSTGPLGRFCSSSSVSPAHRGQLFPSHAPPQLTLAEHLHHLLMLLSLIPTQAPHRTIPTTLAVEVLLCRRFGSPWGVPLRPSSAHYNPLASFLVTH
jgi:hypothetical protein